MNFPCELRNEIWRSACELEASDKYVCFDHRESPWATPSLLSPLLSVNRESRACALIFYHTRRRVWQRRSSECNSEIDLDEGPEQESELIEGEGYVDTGHLGDRFDFKGILYLNMDFTVAVIGIRSPSSYCHSYGRVDRKELAALDVSGPGTPSVRRSSDSTALYVPQVMPFFCLDPLGENATDHQYLAKVARRVLAVHFDSLHCSYCTCRNLKDKDEEWGHERVETYLHGYDTAPSKEEWDRGRFDRTERLGYMPPPDTDDSTTVLHLELNSFPMGGWAEAREILHGVLSTSKGVDWILQTYDWKPIMFWKAGVGYTELPSKYNLRPGLKKMQVGHDSAERDSSSGMKGRVENLLDL